MAGIEWMLMRYLLAKSTAICQSSRGRPGILVWIYCRVDWAQTARQPGTRSRWLCANPLSRPDVDEHALCNIMLRDVSSRLSRHLLALAGKTHASAAIAEQSQFV